MDLYGILELVRITLSFAFLIVSSYFDYVSRRVPNLSFIAFMPAAAALTIVSILLSTNIQTQFITFILYAGITSAIFYAIGHLGLFGGADALIMIGLSLAVPWPLTVIRPFLGVELPILPISIFNNSLLASVIILPYAILSNLTWKSRTKLNLFAGLEKESPLKKIGAMLLCVKKEKSKVQPYDLVAEKSGKLTLFNKVQEEDISQEELQSLPSNVFVMFSLPFVIFITIGFITTILAGDLIILLVKSFLGIQA